MGLPTDSIFVRALRQGWSRWALCPDLCASPAACGGQVERDGRRRGWSRWSGLGDSAAAHRGWFWFGCIRGRSGHGALRREQRLQTVAELGDSIAEGEELIEDDGAGEMERVAGVVNVAGECGRMRAAERDRDWKQIEAVMRGRERSVLRGCRARRVREGREQCGGAKEYIVERRAVGAKRGQSQPFTGKFQFAGPGGLHWMGGCLQGEPRRRDNCRFFLRSPLQGARERSFSGKGSGRMRCGDAKPIEQGLRGQGGDVEAD